MVLKVNVNWIPFVPGELSYPVEDKDSPAPIKLPKLDVPVI